MMRDTYGVVGDRVVLAGCSSTSRQEKAQVSGKNRRSRRSIINIESISNRKVIYMQLTMFE